VEKIFYSLLGIGDQPQLGTMMEDPSWQGTLVRQGPQRFLLGLSPIVGRGWVLDLWRHEQSTIMGRVTTLSRVTIMGRKNSPEAGLHRSIDTYLLDGESTLAGPGKTSASVFDFCIVGVHTLRATCVRYT